MVAVAPVHTVAGWAELDTELDAWLAAGKCASFWWRDDDATQPGPHLERLLAVSDVRPIALAVIPATASPALAGFLRDRPNVSVLQHGYAHQNHAPPEAKKAEFGADRPIAAMRAEIAAGRDRMTDLFGARFQPVFVPPWNRYAAALEDELQGLGLTGLSAYGPRARNRPARIVNCHADIIDWRGGRGFLGEDAVLGAFVRHLSARRLGHADPAEPTGLLTHHRDHDAACWPFIETLVHVLDNHPGAVWTAADTVFSDTTR